MIIQSKCKKAALAAFFVIQGVIWCAFIALDIINRDTTLLKYASIVLCLAFSVIQAMQGGEWIIAAAMAFTLSADTFLLLLDKHYFLGIALFCVVQGLYFVRVYKENGGKSLWGLRLLIFTAAAAALGALDIISAVNVLAIFYFSNFFANAVMSFGLHGRKWRLFSAGLTLFLCCDICVGAFNNPGMIPQVLHKAVSLGMWFFYLPSQVLIVLSGHPIFAEKGDMK